VQLRWNGPVDRTQQIRLWLVSPAMNLALGLIRVVLLFLLVVAFLDLRNWRRHLPATATAKLSALILLTGIPGTGPAASRRNH
jgi:formate/nitrite transporter FocA (FNT family)